jgi:hypothetical protein
MASIKLPPFPDLSKAEYEALRQDIKKNGFRQPVVKDQLGTVIDGKHRIRIGINLHKTVPETIVHCETDQDRIDLAMSLNFRRRNLSAQERTVIVRWLADHGYSRQAIANKVGVAKRTVGRDLGTGTFVPVPNPDSDDVIKDSIGRTIKPRSLDAKHDRQNKVGALWRDGFGVREIADQTGYDRHVIGEDLKEMGYDTRARLTHRLLPPKPLPPPDEQRWRKSPEYIQLQGWFGHLKDKNARARFAAYCREARDGDDLGWLNQAARDIHEWIAYLQDMLDATQSVEATERVAGHDGRDDIGEPPRLARVK